MLDCDTVKRIQILDDDMQPYWNVIGTECFFESLFPGHWQVDPDWTPDPPPTVPTESTASA